MSVVENVYEVALLRVEDEVFVRAGLETAKMKKMLLGLLHAFDRFDPLGAVWCLLENIESAVHIILRDVSVCGLVEADATTCSDFKEYYHGMRLKLQNSDARGTEKRHLVCELP